MTARPTADELVQAVGEHLATKVLPVLSDKRLRFQTLVAAHVLGVVARQLARGEADARAQWEGACRLLGLREDPPTGAAEMTARNEALDARLCERIRAGEFDAGDAATALRAELSRRVEAELSVWQPAFLARVKSGR